MDDSNFQFKGFSIKKSLMEINGETNEENLSVKFKAGGVLNKKEENFLLQLEIILDGETVNINIVSEGYFVYENMEEDLLSGFLFLNAPAILFPYLRAYISTLTNLSGIAPLTLPTLNLTSLRPQLEEGLEVVE